MSGETECEVCHARFTPTRIGHVTCSATCRQRKHRDTYVVTDEDRAAIRRVLQDHGHPRLDPLTPEEVRQHALLNAERT